MAKSRKSKILVAVVLIMTLVSTYSMPVSAFATVPTGSSAQIVAGSDASLQTVSAENNMVRISKVISPTNTENQFGITLNVQTTQEMEEVQEGTAADVVLVIDASTSMCKQTNPDHNHNDKCGIYHAKLAAKAFAAELLNSKDSRSRVSIVAFNKFATTKCSLSNNLTDINAAIDGIKLDDYTNLQSGIKRADAILTSGTSTNADYMVVLTDGETNTYLATDYQGIEHWYGDYDENFPTAKTKAIQAATTAKSNGETIFAVGCNINNGYATWLANNIATKSSYYKGSSNISELTSMFTSIVRYIELLSQAWMVEDPMGQCIKLNEAGRNWSQDQVTLTGGGLSWDLKGLPAKSTTKVGTTTYFNYQLNYGIVLDTEDANFVAGKTYNTNGITKLSYVMVKDGTYPTTPSYVNFKVPQVKGQLPKYNATIKYYAVDKNGNNPVQLKEKVSDSNYYTVGLNSVVRYTTYGTAADSHKNDLLGAGKILSPTEYFDGEVQAPTTQILGNITEIRVYYRAKPKFEYTVEYYKDQITNSGDTAHFLGSTPGAVALLPGSTVEGNQISQTLFKPANYHAVSPTPLTVTNNPAQNVIKVLYAEDSKYQYTVKYYKVPTGGTPQFVTSKAGINSYYKGSMITATTAEQQYAIPNYSFQEVKYGVSDADKLTITDNVENNIMKVYYKEDEKYSYVVKYHKTDLNGNTTEIGTKAGISLYAGSIVTSQAIDKSFKKPNNYNLKQSNPITFGSDNNTSQLVIGTQPAGNVVNVYYVEDNKFGYTVYYVKQLSENRTETITSKSSINTYYAGQKVDKTQIDTTTYKPEHWHLAKTTFSNEDGNQFVITGGDHANVVTVYYEADPTFGYTVEYYKGNTRIATAAGMAMNYENAMATLNPQEKVRYDGDPRFAHWQFSAVVYGNDASATSLKISKEVNNNIMKVVYAEDPKYSYVVGYYKGSQLIATKPGIEEKYNNDQVTLSAIEISAFDQDSRFKNWTRNDKVQYGNNVENDALTISTKADDNIIKVIFNEDKKSGYTVEYYKGTDKIDSATVEFKDYGYVGTTTSAFNTSTANDAFENWHYNKTEIMGAKDGEDFLTLTGDNDKNVIKVYYAEDQKYSYVIEYFKGENRIATAPGLNLEFAGKQIVLTEQQIKAHDDDPALKNWNFEKVVYGQNAEATSLLVSSTDANVIKVVYAEAPKYGYTVEYYDGTSLMGEYTFNSGENFYAGKEVVASDIEYKGKPSGYKTSIQWPKLDDKLVIRNNKEDGATDFNVVKVFYTPAEGTEYKIEFYLQKELGSETYLLSDKSLTSAAITNSTISAIDFKNNFDVKGYSYEKSEGYTHQVKLDSVDIGEFKVVGDGSSVLKMYFKQEGADLSVIHHYPGLPSFDKYEGTTQRQVTSEIRESLIREYGYALDEIKVNGEVLMVEDAKGLHPATSVDMPMPKDGVRIEFYYKKATSNNLVIHHYDGDVTTIGAIDILDDSALSTKGAISFTSLINTLNGKYEAIGIKFKSKIIPMILVELKATLEDAQKLYDTAVDKLDGGKLEEARAKANLDNEITTLSAIKADKEKAYNEKSQELQNAADVKFEIATLTAIKTDKQEIFNTSNEALEAGEWTIPGEGDDPETIVISKEAIGFDEGIINASGAAVAYDLKLEQVSKEAKDAEKEYNDLLAAKEHAAEVLPALQKSVEDSEKHLSETAMQIVGSEEEGIIDNPDYAVAQKDLENAKDALKNAAAPTEDEINAAKEKAENAKKFYEAVKLYVDVYNELRDESGLNDAEADLEKAILDAKTEALEKAAASDERKALDKATKEYDEAMTKANKEYDEAIFELVAALDKENGTTFASDLKEAKKTLAETLARDKELEAYDMLAGQLIEIASDADYEVNIIYKEVGTTNPSNGGGGGGGGHHNSTPDVIIKPEDLPAGPVELPEEKVPGGEVPTALTGTAVNLPEEKVPGGAANLPKTGGIPAMLLYGLGAMLTGGGLLRRRKENSNK